MFMHEQTICTHVINVTHLTSAQNLIKIVISSLLFVKIEHQNGHICSGEETKCGKCQRRNTNIVSAVLASH